MSNYTATWDESGTDLLDYGRWLHPVRRAFARRTHQLPLHCSERAKRDKLQCGKMFVTEYAKAIHKIGRRDGIDAAVAALNEFVADCDIPAIVLSQPSDTPKPVKDELLDFAAACAAVTVAVTDALSDGISPAEHARIAQAIVTAMRETVGLSRVA